MAKKTSSNIDIKSKETLKTMSREDLLIELTTTRKEYYVLRMKKDLGELKQTHLIPLTRRYIARLNTFLASAI